jgi:prepilin-type N-terminal cleavage/methylation domain-containing protein
MKRARLNSQSGFTIIELMIATVVFTVILLVVTVAIIGFSRDYYHGVVLSDTQGTARAIADDVTRSIEFNGGDIVPLVSGGQVRGYCLGSSKRYSFESFQQVDDTPNTSQHQGHHGLVSDSLPGCSNATAPINVKTINDLASLPPTSTNARELLGQHMRLAKLTINPVGALYVVNVKVVYGDDDLVSSPTDPNMYCKSMAGSQFCAVSELTTTVKQRLR